MKAECCLFIVGFIFTVTLLFLPETYTFLASVL